MILFKPLKASFAGSSPKAAEVHRFGLDAGLAAENFDLFYGAVGRITHDVVKKVKGRHLDGGGWAGHRLAGFFPIELGQLIVGPT